MPAPLPYTLAALIVPPLCLVLVLIALALFWRRLQQRFRQLQTRPLTHSASEDDLLPHSQRSGTGGMGASRRAAAAGRGGASDRPRPRRSSTLSIQTTLAVDGTRVLARKERVLSAEVSEDGRRSFFREEVDGARAGEGRRDGIELNRGQWRAGEGAGEGDEDEDTEELASASLQHEPPSAEWMRPSFPPTTRRRTDPHEEREELDEARLGRSKSTFSSSSLAGGVDDALEEFLQLLDPTPPPRAYRGVRKETRGENDELARSRSQTTAASSSEKEQRGGAIAPPLPSTTSPPPQPPSRRDAASPAYPHSVFPPPPQHPSPPSSFFTHSASSHHAHLHPYHRTPALSAPTTLLETALLRSTSSPELRPHRPSRRTTDPLTTLSVFSAPEYTGAYPSSSADLYAASTAWPGSESTFFSAPEQHPLPAPLPSSPAWPPSPPRTPKSPSSPSFAPPPRAARRTSTSPPLTDFPLPSLPRPPRASRPPSGYTLPSSSFGSPVSPTPTTGVTSRWSFRRSTTNGTASGGGNNGGGEGKRTSSSLRWSGSWGKTGPSTSTSRSRRVSKELLAPLSASTRAGAPASPPLASPPSPAPEREELAGSTEGAAAAKEGHGRKASVGTLESCIARGEGVGKVGGEAGVLTLTNPDPSSSSGRPSCDFSIHTSVRLSFETAPAPVG
ncbi:hypothetical protein JCM6882_009442 [Rhodosporidiobolus microsporus]